MISSVIPFVFFFFLSTISAARIGFNVGSDHGLKDIINDGVPINGWNQAKQYNDSYWPPSVMFLWIGGGDDHQQFSVDLTHTGPIEYNGTSAISGTLTLNGPPVMLLTNVLCQGNGQGSGSITFNLAGSGTIQLTFMKECVFPLFSVGYHTNHGYEPLIIDDNKNVPSWNYIFPNSQEIVQFYLWLDSSVLDYSPYTAQVTSTNTRNFNPKISLHGSTAKPAPTSQTPAFIEVELNCPGNRPRSVENATITIAPIGWDSDPKFSVSFSFAKYCGDLDNKPRRGFHMDATNTLTQPIIIDGIVTPTYSDEPGRPYGPDFTTINWFLYLTHVNGYEDYQLYNLNFTLVDDAPHRVKIEVIGDTLGFLTVGQPQSQITLQLTCTADGVAEIRAQVYLTGGYDTTTVYLQMTCKMPHFNVKFQDSLIVNNSEQLPFFYTSPPQTSYDTFAVYLDQTSEVKQQHFAVNNLWYDRANMTVSVNNAYALATIDPNNPTTFSLQFHCPPNKAASINQIQFEIDFGWDVAYQFSYYKSCPYYTPAKSSWTAAGIFFFTVFILLLAFFIFGSIYNYFIQNKRGVEIIPGITYYRRCFQSVTDRSATRYTPQTSEYTAASERDEQAGYGPYTQKGYGSYQTNL